MLQAVTEGVRAVAIRNDPTVPEPGPCEVVILVERVGICGSDAHVYEGSHPYLGFPLVQGHEIVGRIAAIGSQNTALAVGDRVVVEPTIACGRCIACRRGRSNCCVDLRVVGINRPGGLSEALIVEADMVHSVGDLDADVAVLVEPLAVALHAVKRANVSDADTVLVMGAGSIGRSVVVAATSRGARVLVADRAPNRRRLAELLGAEGSVGLSIELLEEAVEAFSAGDGCTVVIETTGSAELLRESLELLAPSGTLVVVGISPDEWGVPVAMLSRKEVAILGSRNSAGDFPEAIALAGKNALALRETITHRFGLEQAEEAIKLVLERTTIGKVIVEVSNLSGSAT